MINIIKIDIKKLYIHVMAIFALKLLFLDRMAFDDAETSLLAINFINCFETSNKLVMTILRIR